MTQVAMGKAHTCVLTKTGEVWTFGVNNKGQCGRDTGAMSQAGKGEDMQRRTPTNAAHALTGAHKETCWHPHTNPPLQPPPPLHSDTFCYPILTRAPTHYRTMTRAQTHTLWCPAHSAPGLSPPVAFGAESMATAMDEDLEDDLEEKEEKSMMCQPGMHKWKLDQCMVCTVCGDCTGYGASCVSSGRPRSEEHTSELQSR